MLKNLFNRIFVLKCIAIYRTSKEASLRVNDFLDLKPELISQNQCTTYLRAGDLLLEVWTVNYPYAYGAKGSFVKIKTIVLGEFRYPVVNGTIMIERDAYFHWVNKMLDATTTVRLKRYVDSNSPIS